MRPYSLLILIALCTLGFSPVTTSAEVFSPEASLIPRIENGSGTLSPFGKVMPGFQSGDSGGEIITLPASAHKDAYIVWTFWGHKRPSSSTWPSGDKVCTEFKIKSPTESTVTITAGLLTDSWVDASAGKTVTLSPDETQIVRIPLPLGISAESIERIRLKVSSETSVPQLIITKWDAGTTQPIVIDPVPTKIYPANDEVITIQGRTEENSMVFVEAYGPDQSKVKDWRTTSNPDGEFSISAKQSDLPIGPLTIRAAAKIASTNQTEWAPEATAYIYPLLAVDETLPMVKRSGRDLIVDGKPWAFLGLNYTRFLLEFSLRTNFQYVAEEFRQYGEWGVRTVRIPIHLGMIQPAPGVFPGDAEYSKIIKAHRLDPEFFQLLEYCISVAGYHGIRVLIDWHEMPTDPYRYFVGGNLNEKKEGKPGSGIAWLYNKETGETATYGSPAHTKAIIDTNRWMASYFKGNGNILGIEVPYNEPHSPTDSSDTVWRRLISDTVLPIITADPERLTFGMPPAWGHNNVLPSTTWQLPDYLTGMAPHHYLANGPVPIRPDAKQRYSPWLAREVAPTFDYSFYATGLPHSAVPAPIFNGESGEHGFESFLPDMDRNLSTKMMLEAQIVQSYAAGWCGNLGWTLTGHRTVYEPVAKIYEQTYKRFSPVFAEGPVDMNLAEVLFVQNPAATDVENGLNHACVPLARLALDLHLAPVHYMTDDQLLSNGLAQVSSGLEQVEHMAADFQYKAAVIDTRNLDKRAIELLKSSKLPILLIDDAESLSKEKLAEFLKQSGLSIDTKTPAEIQLIKGPKHLIAYRRSGEGETTIYPTLKIDGAFKLINESGKTVFFGDSSALTQKGIPVDLNTAQSAIFQIRQ